MVGGSTRSVRLYDMDGGWKNAAGEGVAEHVIFFFGLAIYGVVYTTDIFYICQFTCGFVETHRDRLASLSWLRRHFVALFEKRKRNSRGDIESKAHTLAPSGSNNDEPLT